MGIVFLLASCSKPQSPEFKKIDNIEVREFTFKNVVLKADAHFYNPNKKGIMLKSTDIDVLIDEILVGKVNQDVETKIEGMSDCVLPLVVNFPPEKILKGKGFLDSFLTAVTQKEVLVNYKGNVTVEILGIGVKVPVNGQEKVVIKK